MGTSKAFRFKQIVTGIRGDGENVDYDILGLTEDGRLVRIVESEYPCDTALMVKEVDLTVYKEFDHGDDQ